MKRITILLPGPRREPVGGYKILYQYGDYLAKQGWSVDFTYLTNEIVCNGRFRGMKGKIKRILLSHLKFYNWYSFSSNSINHNTVRTVNADFFKNYNIVICSSVETFIYIDKNNFVEPRKLIYFVQGYENWNVEQHLLDETLSKQSIDYVTISDDLAHKISNAGGKVSLILHNGINHNDFYVIKEWTRRQAASFLFLYHPSERKGCDLLLRTICKIKEKQHFIQFSCFSAYPKPKDFPKFIEYHFRPTVTKLNKLYNANRFFICSSLHEGFGLTPAEAAFAGGIVLTTKNGGVEQYIKDNVTGFVFSDRTEDDFQYLIYKLVERKDFLSDFSKDSSKYIVNLLDLENNFNRLNDYLNHKITNLN